MRDVDSRGTSGFGGCALSGCGALCLVSAVLLGLIGLMKFAQSQREKSTVEISICNIKQELSEPLIASLSNIRIPESNNAYVKVSSRDTNTAESSSVPIIHVTTVSGGQNTSMVLPHLKLVRSNQHDQWHIASDDIDRIAGELIEPGSNNHNTSRSHFAFFLSVILFTAGIGMFLTAKRARRQ